ncbi:MAG TPA: stalk domain-containing protein [Abditibacteriaceae bacterium]|jgi:hypothetical protein
MKKSFVVALVLATAFGAVFTNAARANDSAFSAVGGTMKPIKGQHSSVRMESERIVIDAYAKRYETTVDFIFHNTGKKNVATMGFPEGNYGDVIDSSKKTSFLRFATSVDGVPFRAKRVVNRTNSIEDYDAYWVKVVPFAAGQRRRVRVRYASPYGGNTMLGFSRAINYAFTGGNWKDDVKHSDMVVRVHTPGRHLMMTQWYEGEKEGTTLSWNRRGNVFTRRWSNWQAQGSILVGLVPARAGWLVTKDMATDKTSSWARALGKSQEFKVPGRVPAGTMPFSGYPLTGFVQNGVTFVQLAHLDTVISSATFDVDKTNIPGKVGLKWDAATKTRTLVAGKRRLSWREGRKTWTVDGVQKTLPAAPFVLNDHFYVPAAPVAATLGGKVQSNAAAHWIDIQLPAAR